MAKKGGKRSGGGGGSKQRKYTRDNNGRFASTGTGATARGGRLKTAAGNKRKTQTMQSSAALKGTIGKPKGLKPGTIKPKVAAKPAAAPKPAARTPKAPANAAKARYKMAAGAARAQNSDLRGASASSRRAASTAASRVRLMERNRSTSLPKAAANSPRSRQQSRQIGRIKRAQANQAQAMKNENAGPDSKMSRKASVAKRAQQIYSGKINPKEKTKARLTKTNNPEALRKRIAKIKDNTAAKAKSAAAKAKPAASKAVKRKGKKKVDDSKVSRVISRVNKVVSGSENKTGVKRLNAIQVGARAKSFLARKEGGSVGMLNQKGQTEAFASVRKAMARPPRYSTQSPNRNKPGRYNDLGQDKVRAKARADAMTARERIAKANKSAAAKAKERKGKMPAEAMSRRSLPQLGAPQAPGYVKGPRQVGTIIKPKTSTTPVSSTVARTRTQAKAAQRNRREQILDRARTGVTGLGSMRKNPRIKRSDTGMRQLSLTGKAKILYKFKPIKRR